MKLVLCVMLVVHCAQLTYAHGPAESDFVITTCGSVLRKQAEHALKLRAQANENLCSAFTTSLQTDDSTGYLLYVELYSDTVGMQVGVMYNIVDNDNFDFILFRVHIEDPPTLGYVKEGELVTHEEDSGLWSSIWVDDWAKIHIRVSNDNAMTFRRRMYSGTISNMQFPMKASGGVFILPQPSSGLQAGSLMFRDLQLQALPPPSESFEMSKVRCGPSLSMKNGMLEVEALVTERCVIRPPMSTCDSPDYSISVVVQVDEGRPGLAYNFIDDDNYDFVFFRHPYYDIREEGICFTTGHLKDMILGEEGLKSVTCATDPTFLTPTKLEVRVSADSDVASFYLDDELVGTNQMHFPKTARGGLIMWSYSLVKARFEDLFIRSTNIILGGKF